MPSKTPATKAGKRAAVKGIMDEWKSGDLHSGSKTGPKVTSRKQAIAIMLSERRKEGKGQSRRGRRKARG